MVGSNQDEVRDSLIGAELVRDSLGLNRLVVPESRGAIKTMTGMHSLNSLGYNPIKTSALTTSISQSLLASRVNMTPWASDFQKQISAGKVAKSIGASIVQPLEAMGKFSGLGVMDLATNNGFASSLASTVGRNLIGIDVVGNSKRNVALGAGVSRQMARGAMQGRGYKSATTAAWMKDVGTQYLNNPEFYTAATPLIKEYDSKNDTDENISDSISVEATKEFINSPAIANKGLKVTEEELKTLQSDLANSNLLALDNKVAKRIHDYFLNVKAKPQKISGPLFHGRERTEDEQERPFTQEELSVKAPLGLSSAGRFNEVNQPLYYSCDNEAVLADELKINGEDTKVFDVLKFYPDREMKVLDLSQENQALWSFCLQKVSRLGNFVVPVEYQIPMFIGACLRENRNVQVIKINSAVSHGAINYIFFEPPFSDFVDPDRTEVHDGQVPIKQ